MALLGGIFFLQAKPKEIEISQKKESIYEIFENFPESEHIYYTSQNLYSKFSIGPTIYQFDILAELTEEAYAEFSRQVDVMEPESFFLKINPHQTSYQWKQVKNPQLIRTKDVEVASIQKMYMDENTRTIYIVALGGN